jgi:ribosomal protein L37AE/L43A
MDERKASVGQPIGSISAEVVWRCSDCNGVVADPRFIDGVPVPVAHCDACKKIVKAKK